MTRNIEGTGPEDAIEPVRTHDGWAWVDTNCEGPGTHIVEEVEAAQYTVISRVIDGVDHLQIEEQEPESELAGPRSPTGRVICSSHWQDLDEMR